MLKLVCTTEGIGTHIVIDLRRPRVESLLLIGKLLEDNALKEGEDYDYITTEKIETLPHSTPRREM